MPYPAGPCRFDSAARARRARRKVQALAIACLAAVLGAFPCAAQSEDRPKPTSPSQAEPAADLKPLSIRGVFTLSSLGDLINARPVTDNPDPAFRQMLKAASRADVTIANQESMFFDLASFGGYAPGSPYILLGEPSLAPGLKALGIDMVTTANNHASDWGIEGLVATTRLLDAVGIVHAGDGQTLREAQRARYLETPKGRVALIAAASTFKLGARAQDAIDAIPARPGISGLRLREITLVSGDQMAALRRAYARPGTGDLTVTINAPFAQQIEKTYRIGAQPGYSYQMNSVDRQAIVSAIREGKQNADVAVFALHAHENAEGMDDRAVGAPADFLVTLFHDAVDAGADVVMGTGPHSLRGIEIYRGKPIFYGLGVFLFNGNVVLTQDQRTERYEGAAKADAANPKDASFRTPESWSDGLIAETVFSDGILKEVRLYPIDRRSSGGAGNHERLAGPQRAREILASLQAASRAFGTRISIEGSVGVIRP